MHVKRYFELEKFYHVLNRGVDKREIFLDDEDRFRFIHDLFEFNDTAPINNTNYYFNPNVIARQYIGVKDRRPRKFLIEILTFCLMPNHYHLLIKPKTENGVTIFMKRLNMGYARYFNEKYQRSGALFQSRYKSVAVQKNSHFIHLPYYIHFNPLDFYEPGWRKREIRNSAKALKFLEEYRWSSHLDYLGKKNFPSITQRETLLEFFGNPEKYKNSIKTWLNDLDTNNLGGLSLE